MYKNHIIRYIEDYISEIMTVTARSTSAERLKTPEEVPLKGVDEVQTASGQDDAICLKAKMSLLNGITVIVGSIIGSGIFVSPTGVLKYTGSVNASLIVWTISGLFSMVSIYLKLLCFFIHATYVNITLVVL